MTEKPRFWWFLGSGGVPYTGILGKKSPKNLIPHQRFSWIFDLRIYGGSDPIYGDFSKNGVFGCFGGPKTRFLTYFAKRKI